MAAPEFFCLRSVRPDNRSPRSRPAKPTDVEADSLNPLSCLAAHRNEQRYRQQESSFDSSLGTQTYKWFRMNNLAALTGIEPGLFRLLVLCVNYRKRNLKKRRVRRNLSPFVQNVYTDSPNTGTRFLPERAASESVTSLWKEGKNANAFTGPVPPAPNANRRVKRRLRRPRSRRIISL